MPKKTDPRLEAVNEKVLAAVMARTKALTRLRRAWNGWDKTERKYQKVIAVLAALHRTIEKDKEMVKESKRREKKPEENDTTEGVPHEFRRWMRPEGPLPENQG